MSDSDWWRSFVPNAFPENLREEIDHLARESGYSAELLGAFVVNIWQYEDLTGVARTNPKTLIEIVQEATRYAPRAQSPAQLLDAIDACYKKRRPPIIIPPNILNPRGDPRGPRGVRPS
jgi:hypothetical protein